MNSLKPLQIISKNKPQAPGGLMAITNRIENLCYRLVLPGPTVAEQRVCYRIVLLGKSHPVIRYAKLISPNSNKVFIYKYEVCPRRDVEKHCGCFPGYSPAA